MRVGIDQSGQSNGAPAIDHCVGGWRIAGSADPGDCAVGGQENRGVTNFAQALAGAAGRPQPLAVLRAGALTELTVTPGQKRGLRC